MGGPPRPGRTAASRAYLRLPYLVTGGDALVTETRRVVEAFSRGPHIFNLGHGITPTPASTTSTA
jgi:uroporphyrinogen-III decarboxylase